MPDSFGHDTFLSPFTWRYGSDEMRRIWSEAYKRRLWRRIWVALAEAEHEAGLVTAEQIVDLRTHQNEIDLERAFQIEDEIKHDLMAEVRTYAEQCKIGGGIIHLGATSMDIEDNADALRIKESLAILKHGLWDVLVLLAELIEREADHVCMAFTHLQPAEPTTVGYRLAMYAQDLLADFRSFQQVLGAVCGKGFKGAVGTSASYAELLFGTGVTPEQFEARIMRSLELDAFPIATQTYTRRQDLVVVNALASIASSVYKFAFDVRLLQSPPVGEWAEPFGASQVGSSAMPFKRNPINAENIDSLARYLAALPRVAWDNASHNLLERTLDDSANRRIIFPEAFLTADELLMRAKRIIKGLRIDDYAISRNLEKYGVFAATERLLMAAVRAGGNRQDLHEVIRQHSLTAWEAMRQDQPNPLADNLCADEAIIGLIPAADVRDLLNAETHIGDAPQRARQMAASVRAAVGILEPIHADAH
jgi:adenylosuccinate lyase